MIETYTPLSDFGEKYSLFCLDALCVTLGTLYPPGGRVTVVLDGSLWRGEDKDEDEVRAYSAAVRELGEEFGHLKFCDIADLLTDAERAKLSAERCSFPDCSGDIADVTDDVDRELFLSEEMEFLRDDLKEQMSGMDAQSTPAYIHSLALSSLRRVRFTNRILRRSFPITFCNHPRATITKERTCVTRDITHMY